MELPTKSFIVDSEGKYLFGRYPLPFLEANLADGYIDDYPSWLRTPSKWNKWLRTLRLKEWHFISLNHDDIFVAFALVQLGYVSNLFFYFYDKNTNQKFEIGKRHLFGRNLSFGLSSIKGLTSWHGKSCRIDILNTPSAWEISLAIKDKAAVIEGQIKMQRDEAMALVFPLTESRAAYTHKEAGNRLQGELQINGRRFHFTPDKCFGASDWTRSFLNHVTQWYFACFGGKTADGQRVGINLSRLIYDDQQGVSKENTLWIEGESIQLGEARFILPAVSELDKKPWQIEAYHLQAQDQPCLQLKFEPIGCRKENLSLGILKSKFTQAFGYYSGTIRHGQQSYQLNRTFGVAEKHYSKW